MELFSKRLTFLRKENNLTQDDLAKIINKKRTTVSGYETADKEPDYETLCILAKQFDVSIDYLLGYSNSRKNVDTVFLNDNVNFRRHFESLPEEIKPVIEKTFDSFYLLLNRDMQVPRPERLLLCQKLLSTLQSRRAEIRNRVERSCGQDMDAVALSELFSLQSELKNSVSAILDGLLQADMEIAFNLKKESPTEQKRLAK